MMGAIEVDVDAKIADIATRKKRGKKNVKTAARKKSGKGPENTDDGGSLPGSAGDQKDNGPPGIAVSPFDESVENHFRAMDRICKLSGEAECDDLAKSEFERLSSSITFLREWKHFNYQPRVVRFASQSESGPQGKDVIGGVTLPQFSVATVPKKDGQNGNVLSPESRKDFVMYVGGPVWALDWCPRVHQRPDCHLTCEFIAIAAHPPESSYHKIGSPLIGRGIIQIWCLLHTSKVGEELPQLNKKPKQNPSKNGTLKNNSAESKKPIGRPRKKPINESANNLNGDNQFLQALGVQFPENSSNLPPFDMVSKEEEVPQVNKKAQQDPSKSRTVNVKSTESKRSRGRPRKKPVNESANNLDGDSQFVQASGVQFPENSSELLPLDMISNEEKIPQVNKKPHQDPSKSRTVKVKSTESKRPRGRPRKKPIIESVNNLDGDIQFVQALGVQFPENPSDLLPSDMISNEEEVPQVNKKPQQDPSKSGAVNVKSTESKWARGRPRTKPINESANNLDGDSQFAQALGVQFPENPSELLPLDVILNEEEAPQVNKKPQQDPSKSGEVNVNSTESKRAIGRPRKKPINESANNLDGNCQLVQALGIQFPENPSDLRPVDIVSMDTHEHILKEDSGRKRKSSCKVVSADNLVFTSSAKRRKLKDKARAGDVIHGGLPLLMQNEKNVSFQENLTIRSNSEQDPVGSFENIPKIGSSESNAASNLIPEDVALPRIVLCLAHNGKVAWDVKWRPSNVCDAESKHRMGYLAVLLGNGSLEVWEVPLPQTMKVIHSACLKEGTDPRFVKLEPVFRCSKLKCGDRQSIPLTVEWSAFSPHDFILAGCHDGVVALWKFSANGIKEDTRPLLCFSADTVPIRALAWAPVESDAESANVIVTAGHRGLKFWDIRDPFRPLLELNTVQRIVYSLDWVPDPRCVVVSFDDGTLRILSLVKAASDVPVTGKPFVGTQQQGFYSYYCSSFGIWSVQVSRLTGMVAYCSADGTVLRFQLTNRAVEKDPFRNRAPHFLCGSLTEEKSTLTVVTPVSDTPYPMKKSLNEWGDAPRTIRGFLSVSNQAKRAKEQMAKCQTSDEQTLALCYDNDPGIESGSEDALVSQTSEQPPKSKTSNKKKSKAAQSLAGLDEEPENVGDGVEREAGDEAENFPPKVVAMHRVRWNMNKGSERWLCYGGAGGIVRCQEIGNPAV